MQELSMANLTEIRLRYRKEIDEGIQIILNVNQSQVWNWLFRTNPSSADYNSIKALAEGETNMFMGFRFKIKALHKFPDTFYIKEIDLT